MPDTNTAVRGAFKSAVACFKGVVDQAPGDAWEKLSLGEWSLREPVGHTCRSLLNLELYSTCEGG